VGKGKEFRVVVGEGLSENNQFTSPNELVLECLLFRTLHWLFPN